MKIKICGVIHTKDAEYAAKKGADYIGINFSPLSKRYVKVSDGQDIAEAARQNRAEPVGIFVHETLEEIFDISTKTGIKTVQLHGDGPRLYFKELQSNFSVIYATAVDSKGNYSALPPQFCGYLLCDYPCGGSGKKFNWKAFIPPQKPWFLAGGLNPENVERAIELLNPFAVDVASGVEIVPGGRKDPDLVKNFIENVKRIERRNDEAGL